MEQSARDIINSLFGDSESMTREAFTEAVEKAGIKLADLSKGEFVTAAKYNERTARLEKERDEAKAKIKDYEDKETKATQLEKLAGLGVKKEFQDFVLAQVAGSMKEGEDFEASATAYMKDHAQYAGGEDQHQNANEKGQDKGRASGLVLGNNNSSDKEGGDYGWLTSYLKTGEQ